MEYRINQRTSDKISVLGFGTSYIAEASEKDAVAAIQRAYAGCLPIRHQRFRKYWMKSLWIC